MSTAYVGDERSVLEFLLNTVERRYPLRRKVRHVSGSEEALGSFEEVVVVLVPTEAFSVSESVLYLPRPLSPISKLMQHCVNHIVYFLTI